MIAAVRTEDLTVNHTAINMKVLSVAHSVLLTLVIPSLFSAALCLSIVAFAMTTFSDHDCAYYCLTFLTDTKFCSSVSYFLCRTDY